MPGRSCLGSASLMEARLALVGALIRHYARITYCGSQSRLLRPLLPRRVSSPVEPGSEMAACAPGHGCADAYGRAGLFRRRLRPGSGDNQYRAGFSSHADRLAHRYLAGARAPIAPADKLRRALGATPVLYSARRIP